MIDATFFDGNSARRHAVTLVIHKGVAAMRGEGVSRSLRLSKLEISERLRHAPRILRFPDGAFIEADDHARLDKMLAQNGYRTPRAVRWQNNWPLSLLALAGVLSMLVASYQWGLPLAADRLAQHLPPSIEKTMGDRGLAAMDEYLAPSTLSAVQQARLRSLFAALKPPHGDQPAYRLEFRSSPMGPNAFALPNGVIVMTDQLLQLTKDDDAIVGVLSHELGHVQRHHSGRHLLQALGVGVVLNLWLGDAPGAIAAIPAIMLSQKHSRDFEREADQYAIDMMRANGRPLGSMATLFESMAAAKAGRAGSGAGESEDEGEDTDEEQQEPEQDYLSSHPSDAERIARLRAHAH
jgi:Zn-dependent protease with chaperone function